MAPNPEPFKVTCDPGCAAGGARLEITGLMTVKFGFAELVTPPTVTLTGPVPEVAAEGTSATICVFVQLVIEVAATPLNWTELPVGDDPKFEPVIVTEVPVPPRPGDTPVTKGVVPIAVLKLSKVPVAVAEVL